MNTAHTLAITALASLVLSLLACGGGDGEDPSPDDAPIIGGITLMPREVVVEAGDQVNLSAIINANQAVDGVWSAPQGILAPTPGSIFATYTPPPAPGEYFVRYAVADQPELFAEARIVIKAPTARTIRSDARPLVGPLPALDASPGGERVVVIDDGGDGQLVVLGGATLALEGRVPGRWRDVRWGRGARELAVVDADGARVLSMETGYTRIRYQTNEAVSAFLSDDGASLLVLTRGEGRDCGLIDLNLRDATRRDLLRGDCDANRIASGPDGASVLVTGGSIQHISILTGQQLPTRYAREVASALRPHLYFSADGQRLLAAGRGQIEYHLLAGPDFDKPLRMQAVTPPVWAAAAAPQGATAALALGPGQGGQWGEGGPASRRNLHILDMQDGAILAEHAVGAPSSLFGVAFVSPEHVVVAGEEPRVWRLNALTGQVDAQYPAQD